MSKRKSNSGTRTEESENQFETALMLENLAHDIRAGRIDALEVSWQREVCEVTLAPSTLERMCIEYVKMPEARQ